MKKSISVVLAVSALFILPPTVSAGMWDIEPTPAGFPFNFTVAGGALTWTTAGTSIGCSSVSGTGSYENATTGKISLTLHGCKGPFGVTCTSAGAPAGTLVFTQMAFHNVLLEASPRKAGILFTPNTVDNIPAAGEGHFLTFSCLGITWVVRGSGMIGEVSAPECGKSSKTGTLSFRSPAAGVQEWKQITTSGTSYSLTSKTGSSAYEQFSFDMSLTTTYERESKYNCT